MNKLNALLISIVLSGLVGCSKNTKYIDEIEYTALNIEKVGNESTVQKKLYEIPEIATKLNAEEKKKAIIAEPIPPMIK